MGLLERLRARLAPGAVPPRCFACRQEEMPLELVGPNRWWCAVCAKDFEATPAGEDTWRVDLRPLRERRRAS